MGPAVNGREADDEQTQDTPQPAGRALCCFASTAEKKHELRGPVEIRSVPMEASNVACSEARPACAPMQDSPGRISAACALSCSD